MRGLWVGAGIASLLVTGLTAPPVTAVERAADTTVQAVTPAPNPSIDETCGLDASLILDSSGSIQSAHAVDKVRTASRDLITALKDTNSTLRITQFATLGYTAVGNGQLSPRVPVNATTTGAGGQLTQAITSYYNPLPQRPSDVSIYNNGSLSNRSLTATNWQDGLKAIDITGASKTELAIFITDGDPNAYNSSAKRVDITNRSTGSSLDTAITQANLVKAAGTRMLVVGVGNGLTKPESQQRLRDISGSQFFTSPAALTGKTINQVDAVAFTDFAALGAFLRSVVTSLCGNSVTVQKLAQSSSDGAYLPTAGWDVTVQPTIAGGFRWVDPIGPDNSAQTRATSGAQGTAAFQWKPKVASQSATVNVTETVKNDFTADRWSCDVKKTDGTQTTVSGNLTNQTPSFQFAMNPSDVATCKLYNDFNYAPNMTVTKVARDNPVRGNADGWNQQYTFTVTNTGNAALTIAKPVDPQCTSITGPTGPGTDTGKLAPNAAWTYTCTAKIGPVATVTTPLSKTNTVTVTGVPPKGSAITRTAQATVDVKTPGINIVKTAEKTVSGDPIPDGGSVPAGSLVTYLYSVTNTGNDVLNLVRATAVTDNKCSPVQYVSGDVGDDQKLGLTETWLYECTTRLNPPRACLHKLSVVVGDCWAHVSNPGVDRRAVGTDLAADAVFGWQAGQAFS